MEFPRNWKPFPSLTPGSLSRSRGGNAQVRCWEIAANGTSVAKAQQSYSQPLLCSSWAADGSTVYTGGCDHQVAAWNLATNQSQVLLPPWSPQIRTLHTRRCSRPVSRSAIPARAPCVFHHIPNSGFLSHFLVFCILSIYC